MKRIFTLFFYSCCSLPLIGQSVTISPSAPSAIIQSSSTTKGFLAPVMSKNQRDAIVTPVNGLMIFQSPTIPNYAKGFYWYDGNDTAWYRLAGDDDLGWKVYNGNVHSKGTMNIGIGTTLPTDKLHIRTSTASAGITFEGTNPTFQFRQRELSSATYTDKGFIQLADDNLRIGVNSSNTAGRFIIRTQGADQIEVLETNGGAKMHFNAGGTNVGLISASSGGNLHITTPGSSNFVGINNEFFVTNGERVGIGTTEPAEKLEVRGNVRIIGSIAMAGEITKTNVEEGSFLPLCYGKVGFSGERASGSSNFTSENTATGRYKIYHPSILHTSTIIVTLNSSNAQIIASAGCGTGDCTVHLKDGFSNENRFDPVNQAFYFVIYR
ncbi:hypothetical protein [Emticicia sp. C21]|uniref:hypothetical protein n=1 Tax=Emticicia sp. C21 TaxID=2302915 RepID=UPI000E34C459|nr:hypothetical protein [Emticicia sp. C21]RFS16803.1 hypothetical protein D0T08_08975 [Emticicia sp. C21]